ncbi:MAG: C40 family peptidase [Oscillospiraceae bacterium]|nr:C40 family peptidase [Oscillospiraceae bacterium]
MVLKFQNKNKTIFAWIMTILMVLTISSALLDTPVQAVSKSELNALKQQQAQLAQKKAGIQAQADELSNKVASQTEQLELLSEQLEITNQEIEVLSEQIAIYTNSIAQMENQLVVDKQKEQKLLEHYKTRMRAMEENGSATYISILLGASSFQDLLSRIYCIRDIMEYDDGLVEEVQAAQVKVKQAKEDMEAEMAAQQEVFLAYQDKKEDLLNQQEKVEAVLASLTADSADYQKQLASVNALVSAIGGQISNMADALAEQERLQAEQNASNQISSGNSGSSNSGNSGSNWYGDAVASGTGQDIVNYAQTFLGVPYVYGGTSPSGFDCSGLVYYCYKHFGYTVNRTAAGLAYSGTAVSSSALQVGDVILFTSTDGSYVGHTGIYIGGGQFIHAPHTGDVVKISSLSDSYYTSHYWGARRIIS